MATLIPDNGVTAISTADVDGINIGGLLIDAGTSNSQVLVQIGQPGSTASHVADPASIHDVFFRIGGAAVGKATQSLLINSNNVVGDHMWLWRGDHTYGVGWTVNTANNGLVVNGNDVTMYGSLRRALPAVQRALERQRRPDVLLPERAPVRRARPGVVDQRRRQPGLGRVQGGEFGDQPRGLGRRQLLLLQHQQLDRGQPCVRGAGHPWGQVPRPGHGFARGGASAPSATSSTTPARPPTHPTRSAPGPTIRKPAGQGRWREVAGPMVG